MARKANPARIRSKSLPYQNATSGKRVVQEIEKIVKAFGATSFGVMEDFDKGEVFAQFEWRGHRVMIPVSGKGYAAVWLHQHPHNTRMRISRIEYERRALERGQISRWSILRDLIKGQITAVECGIIPFKAAFLPWIQLPNGETVLEYIEREKFLPLPPPTH